MAHRFMLPIWMELGPDGTPLAFTWRGERYHMLQVLARRHLRDRWWVHPVAVALGDEARGQSDRHYYLLLVPDCQVFDLYHDSVSNVWVLDGVQD